MPSTSSRSRVAARRSPRSAPLRPAPAPVRTRPLEATFAAVFAFLVAAEYLYLAWLLYTPGASWDWYIAVPVLLAGLSMAGAVLVVVGRGRGWLVLTAVSVVLFLGLLALVALFGALAGGTALWQPLLLLIGPIGCLALTLRRPVRAWTGRARRSAGGRRGGGGSR